MSIDRDTSIVTIRTGGVDITMPWRADRFEESSAIRRITYEVGAGSLRFETRLGDEVVAELPQPHDPAPIGGRPIVYLDQNHWSTLAWTIHRPETVVAAEREAAECIIHLAHSRQIILPMSSGHMGETCQWRNGDRRYQLALTILRLSRGWQMRDPLALRSFELRQALVTRFRGRGLPALVPFTLEPGALHASRDQRSSNPMDLPPELEFAARALSSVSTNVDVMLDAEPVLPLPVPGWAETLQRFTDWLATESRDDRQRRERSRVAFLADLTHELAAAAHEVRLQLFEVGDWFTDMSDGVIGTMPSLGIYRELMHEKLLNPGTSWEGNDLIDMMYLSCAAAYADHVVAERRTTGHLRNALRRLDRPTKVYRCLRDLVLSLTDL